MYQVEKGVPVPEVSSKYPFKQMDVGDSFVFELDKKKQVSAAANHYAKKTGFGFTIREDGDGFRIWRVK